MPRARKPAAPAPQAEEDGFAALLASATGTRHVPLAKALLSDATATLGLAKNHPQYDDRGAAMFALMKEFRPANGVEGSIAAAYASLHNAGMQLLRRVSSTKLPPEDASRLRRDARAMFRTAFEAVTALRVLRGEDAKRRD